MKKIIFFVFIVLFGFSVNVALAQVLAPRGLGGKIIMAPTPGISCPAGKPGSPFTILPVSLNQVGPYIGDYNPISMGFNLTPGSWFLGLYIPVPIPECSTQSAPPAPVSGYRTILHGTSSY
jgi:hypothetical protein